VTDTAVELETVERVESAQLGQPVPVSDEQLVAMLVERARSEGLQLTGIRRAGAQSILAYWAVEAARMLR
jgi:hypothetical protein